MSTSNANATSNKTNANANANEKRKAVTTFDREKAAKAMAVAYTTYAEARDAAKKRLGAFLAVAYRYVVAVEDPATFTEDFDRIVVDKRERAQFAEALVKLAGGTTRQADGSYKFTPATSLIQYSPANGFTFREPGNSRAAKAKRHAARKRAHENFAFFSADLAEVAKVKAEKTQAALTDAAAAKKLATLLKGLPAGSSLRAGLMELLTREGFAAEIPAETTK